MSPINDHHTSATVLDLNEAGWEIIDFYGAGIDGDEPPYAGGGGFEVAASRWWQFTADNDELQHLFWARSVQGYRFTLELWATNDSADPDDWSLITYDTGSIISDVRRVWVWPDIGQRFIVRLSTDTPPNQMGQNTIDFAWAVAAPIEIEHARELEGSSGTAIDTDVGGMEAWEQNIDLVRLEQDRRWFKWTAPEDGRVHFWFSRCQETSGFPADSVIAAYKGTPEAVELLDDDTRFFTTGTGAWQTLNGATMSRVTSPVQSGTTHSLAVTNLPTANDAPFLQTPLLPIGEIGVLRVNIALSRSAPPPGFNPSVWARTECYDADGNFLGLATLGERSPGTPTGTVWLNLESEQRYGGPPAGTTHVRLVLRQPPGEPVTSPTIPASATIYINSPSLIRTLASVQAGTDGTVRDAYGEAHSAELKFEVEAGETYWIRAMSFGMWFELSWALHRQEDRVRNLFVFGTGFPNGIAVWAVDRDTGDTQDWIWRGDEDGYFNMGDADADGNLYYFDQYFDNVEFANGRRVKPRGSEIDTQWALGPPADQTYLYGEAINCKGNDIYADNRFDAALGGLLKLSQDGEILDEWTPKEGNPSFDIAPDGKTLFYVNWWGSDISRSIVYRYDLEARTDLPDFIDAWSEPIGPQRLTANNAEFAASLGNWAPSFIPGGMIVTRDTSVAPHSGAATLRLETNSTASGTTVNTLSGAADNDLCCELNGSVSGTVAQRLTRMPVTPSGNPNKFYRFRVWMRKDPANTNHLGAAITLRYFSAAGVQVASVSSTLAPQDFPTSSGFVVLTGDWRSVQIMAEPPGSAAFATVTVRIVGGATGPTRNIAVGEKVWLSGAEFRDALTPLVFYEVKIRDDGKVVVYGHGDETYFDGAWFRIYEPDGTFISEFRWVPFPHIAGEFDPPFYAYTSFRLDPDDQDYVWKQHTGEINEYDEDGLNLWRGMLFKVPLFGTEDEQWAAMRQPFAMFGRDTAWEGPDEIQSIVATTGQFWEEGVVTAEPELGIVASTARIKKAAAKIARSAPSSGVIRTES